MGGSLAYRKNEAAILRGEVPEKYTRLLPYIEGENIIELGSAEGVLALLLARQGKQVTAIEANRERHASAFRLANAWKHRFDTPGSVTFVNKPAGECLDLFEGQDSLVAVRMIYYLRDQLDGLFAEIAKAIPRVMLCGNKNRAAWWRQGIPDKDGGPFNYYASQEGMRALLERHGYSIIQEETDGDPIVVGRK